MCDQNNACKGIPDGGMGRITIFTRSDCSHCSRAKSAFDTRGIPYVEISLSDYPERRSDMLALSDRMSVPQVFFNDEHVGGADETLQLLARWDDQKTCSSSPLERYQKEVASTGPPKSVGLAIPTAAPHPRRPPPQCREVQGCIELPNGDKMTVVEVTTALLEFMPRPDLPWLARIYKDCFVGERGVTAMVEHFGLSDRETAVQFGRTLQRMQVLHHVVEEHTFCDSWFYFRLQPFQEPNVLNSFRIWTDSVDPDANNVVVRLLNSLTKILSSCTNADGSVDYVAAEKTPEYVVFDENVCELQGINTASLDESSKLALSINLYNLMIKHAFVKVGIPSTSMQRSTFFKGVLYNIGGDLLSLDQVEHGCIRANTRHPYGLSTPFRGGDPRRRLVVNRLDARIHFALNCGSKSCPPVNVFSPDAIDEELRIVTQAFCEDDANVSIDEDACSLTLSMLFKWYSGDFAKSASQLPEVVVTYLRGQRKETLLRMVQSGRTISIKFHRYNWNTNAFRSRPFDSSRLDPNEITVEAISARR